MITNAESGSNDAFRQPTDDDAHSKKAGPFVEALAATESTTLAGIHGGACRGEASALMREPARRLAA
jgi:hypothetical protein